VGQKLAPALHAETTVQDRHVLMDSRGADAETRRNLLLAVTLRQAGERLAEPAGEILRTRLARADQLSPDQRPELSVKELQQPDLAVREVTAPYGHDGRSINLSEVILRHGGEAQAERDAFAGLLPPFREAVVAFLNTLILFPPDDTASNLNPGNPSVPGFPQFGHGSIALTGLFDDPSDPE
jgi:hypothetical protein